MIQRQRTAGQQGFTIIEMMIATVIFSIIMIVITSAILQFTRQYYRGVIESNTQATARAIMNDLVRSIQFNKGGVQPLNGGNGYCVGNSKRYSVALNRQVKSTGAIAGQHQGVHGFVSDTLTGCSTMTPALDVPALGSALTTQNARELLGEHMRLAKFSIVPNAPPDVDVYTITLRLVYGDDDVLTSATDPDAKCKPATNAQFCAVSELKTTVKQRVN